MKQIYRIVEISDGCQPANAWTDGGRLMFLRSCFHVPEVIANQPLLIGRPRIKTPGFYVHSAADRLYRPVFAAPHRRRVFSAPSTFKAPFEPSAGRYLVRMCFNFLEEYKKLLA
jgi:hypothetical protein